MNDAWRQWNLKEIEAAAAGAMLKTRWLSRRRIQLFDAVFRPWVWAANVFHKPEVRKTDAEIRKILVVEYANFGDIVLLTPLLQNLRVHYPLAQITLLASPKTEFLLKGSNLVDDVVTIRVPQGMYLSRRQRFNFFSPQWLAAWRRLRQLRSRKFDLALTARIDVLDNAMLWLTGAARRVAYGMRGGRYFLTDIARPDLDHVHGADRWLGLLDVLGKPVMARLPQLQILPEEDEQGRQYLCDQGIRKGDVVIGIHPGARSPIRQWGNDKFRQVAKCIAQQFDVKLLWFQDPAAGVPVDAAPEGAISVQLDIRSFMAVLSRCQLFICNDSGPMHMAAALGVPVVAVFGATEPAWFGPLGLGHRVVIREGFWCRSCGDRCLFDQPYCLKTISVNEVFDAAAEAILSLGASERRQPVFEVPPGRWKGVAAGKK